MICIKIFNKLVAVDKILPCMTFFLVFRQTNSKGKLFEFFMFVVQYDKIQSQTIKFRCVLCIPMEGNGLCGFEQLST